MVLNANDCASVKQIKITISSIFSLTVMTIGFERLLLKSVKIIYCCSKNEGWNQSDKR